MPMFHDGRTVASPSSLYRHTSPRSGIIQERCTARTKCRGIGMRRGFGARQRGPCAIYQNDDWGTTANANQMVSTAERIGAASLRSGWQDAALLLTLPPGVYSAIVSGSANTTGVWNGRVSTRLTRISWSRLLAGSRPSASAVIWSAVAPAPCVRFRRAVP